MNDLVERLRFHTATLDRSLCVEAANRIEELEAAAETTEPTKSELETELLKWTREMSPAIEGVLRQAIREDTAVSLDSVLLAVNEAADRAEADRVEALERIARVDASLAQQLSRSMALNATLQARIQALEVTVKELETALRMTTEVLEFLAPGDATPASLLGIVRAALDKVQRPTPLSLPTKPD
jgi:hypothetical protein